MVGGASKGERVNRHFKSIAPCGFYLHGILNEAKLFGDEGGGNHAASAGEGFGFDAAFEGADGEGVGAGDLNKVGIGAVRGEEGMASDVGAQGGHIDQREIVHQNDGVGYAAVDELDRHFLFFPHDGKVRPPVLGMRKMQADARREDLGAHESGGGLDLHVGGGGAQLVGEAGDAPRPVSAKVGFGPVGIEKAHAEISHVGGLNQEEAFGSDAPVAVAKAGDEVGILAGEQQLAVIQKDEVVTGTVHFPEGKFHGESMP